MIHPPAGWRLVHLTDRVVELRKDDWAYRRVLGRDGFVRVRAEPGMDRHALIDKALELAKQDDAEIAERVGKDLMPRNIAKYRLRQRRWAPVMATPEEPELIGVKRA